MLWLFKINFRAFCRFLIHGNSSCRIAGKFDGGGKFGEFGELSVIRQTKTIQINTYNK